MAKQKVARICSIENCGRSQHGGGYCDSHYHRWKRHGDPLVEKFRFFTSIFDEGFIEYFWMKVGITANPDKCWHWLHAKTSKGYGMIGVNKIKYYAHRLAWGFENGRSPNNELEILHSCDNPSCCNPKHLREDTHRENMLEASDRGLLERGSDRYNAILNEEHVRDIRQRLANGETGRSLALQYGVKAVVISSVKHRRTWKHVD